MTFKLASSLPLLTIEMGKTREFFKKIRDIKGKFYVRMGTIKYRNSKDLRKEEIKKRWHEYMEGL